MAEIAGLYSTGIGFSVNTKDSNWELSVTSGSCTSEDHGYVAADGEPNPAWDESDLTDARWLTPSESANQYFNLCTFLWRLSFDISAEYNPASAAISLRFQTDDIATIELNGSAKYGPGGTFTEWTDVNISGGFVSGTNTLDFIVRNAVSDSPTGLRVDFVSSSISSGTTNATMFLFSGGLA